MLNGVFFEKFLQQTCLVCETINRFMNLLIVFVFFLKNNSHDFVVGAINLISRRCKQKNSRNKV